MMTKIPERTNSEKLNKMLSSSTTKKIGNLNSYPSGRQYNTGSYNSINSSNSTRSQSPNFSSNQNHSENTHWVRKKSITVTQSLTFPLNY